MTHSVCSCCSEPKPLADYRPGNRQCNGCLAAKKRERRLANHPSALRERAYHKEWNAKNAEKNRQYRDARTADPEWRARHLEARRQQYQHDRNYLAAKRWLRRIDATEEFKQKERAMHARYRPAVLAKRRASMKSALPAWAVLEDIKAVYAGAKRMSERFGRAFHVDHIVPISSPLVCGLHVQANLQVLDKTLNMEKNNRWWPEMWA